MKWQTLCGSQGHAFEFSISTKLNSFLSYLFATVGFMLFCSFSLSLATNLSVTTALCYSVLMTLINAFVMSR